MRDFHFTLIFATLIAAIATFIFLNGGGWIGLIIYLVVIGLIGAAATI